MKKIRKLTIQDRRQIRVLLAPSTMSGFVAIMVGVGLTIGLMAVMSMHTGALLPWEPTDPSTPLTKPGETLVENDNATVSGSWPLFIVWCFVGLFSYAIAAFVIHTISEAYRIEQTMEHAHKRPLTIFEAIIERLVLRVVAATVLLVLFVLFVVKIIPLCAKADRISLLTFGSLHSALSILLSFGVIVLSLHTQAILLRLAAGRVRIFSDY